MSAFPIPDDGLLLESPGNASDVLPAQAFGITLDDDAIEDMIKCVQNGGEIELTLGKDPNFLYGSSVQPVITDPDFEYDLFCTNPEYFPPKAERYPNPTMSILKSAPAYLTQGQADKKKSGKSLSSASSSGPESEKGTNGRAKLGVAAPKDLKRGKASASLGPPGKKAIAGALSGNSNRSLPPSPALPGVSSPYHAITASDKLREKNIKQRSIIVHELAARDQTFEHLETTWMGPAQELKPTLEKVAKQDAATQKWSLNKIYWKELDVWNYDYDSQDDRQSAIDNAIRQFDKQRLGTTSPEWEKLLPPSDRGKGIVLSKLQDKIAKTTNLAPASKPGKSAEDGAKSDVDSKPKAESMARSSSQQSVTKTKKPSEQEKRLFSNKAKKPAPVPKQPVNKVKATEDKNRRVLSSEIAIDSSDSDDEKPLSLSTSAPSAKPKPASLTPKPTEKPLEKPKPKPAAAPATKPKPVVRAPRAPSHNTQAASAKKRPREDDDSSSSSGTPLSKRIKPKEPLPPKPVTSVASVKSRPVDTTNSARGVSQGLSSANNLSVKSKNTSPVKSSPLASSPPTNASDMDDSSQSQRSTQRSWNTGPGNGLSGSAAKKRKEIHTVTSTVSNKKPRVSKEILKRASAFTRYYERYELLHKEISALKDPPRDKVADLLEMRERLVTMKSEISRQVEASA